MQTIEKIEKRRRELHYISLFLIYFLSLVVFGLFFFIDEFAGFWAALQYNIFLRTLFVILIIAFIIYLAQKERMQGKLTKQLLDEMSDSSERLRKELRQNKFMAEVSHLAGTLSDNDSLVKLFDTAARFFHASGGAVVLKGSGRAWKPPLIAKPQGADREMIMEISRLVGKSGRSFIQPHPDYPDHGQIKAVNSVVAVPLRLENRLYGVIMFWAEASGAFDESDMAMMETLARETSSGGFGFEQAQGREDQLEGLLLLISQIGDEQAKTKKQTEHLIIRAQAIGRNLGLKEEAIEAIATAAHLRHIGLIANGVAPTDSGPADIVAGLGFPPAVVAVLSRSGKSTTSDEPDSHPRSAQALALAELYVSKAFPARGRRPAPANVLAKIEKEAADEFSPEVLAALKATLDIS